MIPVPYIAIQIHHADIISLVSVIDYPSNGTRQRPQGEWKTLFKIEKAGLVALATKFGVKGSPIGSRSTHLELGKKIYGENHECLQYEEQPKLSTEELQVKIKEKVPTAEEWAVMGPKERREFKIASMGLHAIATQFGMKKSPVHQPSAHFELGRKVYGEDHECFKELTLEELRIKIIEKVPTFQEWTGMTSLQRRAFMIGRLKLNAIARQFGVTGSPLQRKSVHLELGRKIYESVAVSV